MVVQRGSVYWADLGAPRGSAPAKRRPVLVVQDDRFNRSALRTVIVATITSNTQTAEHPGNVFVPASASGLSKDAAVNVSQLQTLDKDELGEEVGSLPPYLVNEVSAGIRLVLTL
ncbi:type II toxin-antitoxin system PemK/MazF family toxin [Subtercola endophyticus]|uniref:type II toxin-antitoxin system PemK/MazF family toxin n=1 Tax=Subtercola endophyticus TaxID=2895559 RepID=UPI001E2CF16C|nr:type II toxin-antitoxin system PemK/MazF family toxin [Subtercola endophyticus]UFS59247.1 type II toxin-antitoxin system PemK/MazF family toxin [Subtercola endophyticus]